MFHEKLWKRYLLKESRKVEGNVWKSFLFRFSSDFPLEWQLREFCRSRLLDEQLYDCMLLSFKGGEFSKRYFYSSTFCMNSQQNFKC